MIFGSFDGLNTAVGAVAGSQRLLFGLALCISVAGMMSMAMGEWLSDDDVGIPAVAAMGVATFAGTFLPCLPAIFLPRTTGLVALAAIGMAVSFLVGVARGGRRRQIIIAAGTFLAVAIPTAVIGLVFGGAA